MQATEPRLLFLTNLAILLISLCAGRWLYSGALGWGDALNMYSPYPWVSMRGAIESLTAWDYIRNWYAGQNGRIIDAFVGSLFFTYSRLFAPIPESFPWWLLRSLSLFCTIAAPVNFVYACGFFRRQAAVGILGFAAVWALWTINNNTYSYSLWLDMLFADKYLPMYLLSLMACGVSTGWFDRDWMRWSILALTYFMVSHEQFLLSVPIILLAYSVPSAPALGVIRSLGKRIASYSILSVCAAVTHFMSPGQQLRMTMIPHHSLGDLSLTRLWDWYRDAIPLGYDVLLAPDDLTMLGGFDEIWSANGSVLFWGLHTILVLAVLGMTVISYSAYREADRRKLPHKDRMWELFAAGFLASSFMVAYPASLASLIFSGYFPQYAIHYPALLLAIGLVCCFAFVIRFFGSETFWAIHRVGTDAVDPRNEALKDRRTRRAALFVFATILTLVLTLVTIPNMHKIQSSYREVVKQNALRRSIYKDLLDRNQRDGDTHFILSGFPANSLGMSIEAPWALAAYFRWHHRPEITVYVDNNSDYAGRPLDKKYVAVSFYESLQP